MHADGLPPRVPNRTCERAARPLQAPVIKHRPHTWRVSGFVNGLPLIVDPILVKGREALDLARRHDRATRRLDALALVLAERCLVHREQRRLHVQRVARLGSVLGAHDGARVAHVGDGEMRAMEEGADGGRAAHHRVEVPLGRLPVERQEGLRIRRLEISRAHADLALELALELVAHEAGDLVAVAAVPVEDAEQQLVCDAVELAHDAERVLVGLVERIRVVAALRQVREAQPEATAEGEPLGAIAALDARVDLRPRERARRWWFTGLGLRRRRRRLYRGGNRARSPRARRCCLGHRFT